MTKSNELKTEINKKKVGKRKKNPVASKIKVLLIFWREILTSAFAFSVLFVFCFCFLLFFGPYNQTCHDENKWKVF
jgi:hypothetical protein